MAKKRKTRAQKARTTNRRHQQLTRAFKPTSVPQPAKDVAIHPEVSETAPTKKTEDFRSRDLAASLRLLTIFILVQIGLWLVFVFTNLDEQLYSLLRI